MPLETTLQELVRPLARWQEALEALHFTVTEDRPIGDDVALADFYENAVTDALSSLHEAVAHSSRAVQAITTPGQMDSVRRSLYRIHVAIVESTHRCAVEMSCWERLRELDQLGWRRGPEWSCWSQTIYQSLERLPELSRETQQALAACWQELAGNLPPNPAALEAAFKLRN